MGLHDPRRAGVGQRGQRRPRLPFPPGRLRSVSQDASEEATFPVEKAPSGSSAGRPGRSRALPPSTASPSASTQGRTATSATTSSRRERSPSPPEREPSAARPDSRRAVASPSSTRPRHGGRPGAGRPRRLRPGRGPRPPPPVRLELGGRGRARRQRRRHRLRRRHDRPRAAATRCRAPWRRPPPVSPAAVQATAHGCSWPTPTTTRSRPRRRRRRRAAVQTGVGDAGRAGAQVGAHPDAFALSPDGKRCSSPSPASTPSRCATARTGSRARRCADVHPDRLVPVGARGHAAPASTTGCGSPTPRASGPGPGYNGSVFLKAPSDGTRQRRSTCPSPRGQLTRGRTQVRSNDQLDRRCPSARARAPRRAVSRGALPADGQDVAASSTSSTSSPRTRPSTSTSAT